MNEEFSQELIDKWKGGNVILFEYRISHGFLRLAVTSEIKSGCLDIQCGDTEYIRGKTRWANCEIEIENVDYKTEIGVPINFTIKDKTVDFEVHCGFISVIELNDFNDLV